MKIKTFVTLTIILLLISFSCKETPPEPGNGGGRDGGMLTVEDVGVTDAVLRLRVPGGFKSRSITLKRDTTTILSRQITSLDLTIVDEKLLPKHSYRYTLTVENFFNLKERSYADVITMDTTSHNFTWQIDTLGDGNSSILRDVAIINDTCILVVGEIYKNDTLGNYDPEPYGAAIWNGDTWKLIKVPYHDYGSTKLYPGPLRAIYSFGINNVFMASFANLLQWNGKDFMEKVFFMKGIPFNGQVNKIWGTSENNLYCVGLNGAIYHVKDTLWERMESGTDVSINDIFGTVNPITGEKLILCAASNILELGELKILRINENNYVDTIPWSTGRRISSIWFKNQYRIFTAGGGVFKGSINGVWNEVKDIPLIFTERIRGNNINDLFVVGHFGVVAHFNGVSWQIYPEVAAALYYSCDYKNNMMVAVGDRNGKAIILRMKR